MQTQLIVNQKIQPQHKAAETALVKTAPRLGYIDILRGILTIMVIMVHAAVTYGSLGDWTYTDPVQDELTSIFLSIFVIISQSFFMGLFFFFSGYFLPRAFDKKGPLQFWKDRLLRLAVPLVAYTWFMSRIPNFINAVANSGYQGSFMDYVRLTIWSSPDKGPTWFLFALLMFCAAYTIFRLAARLLRRDHPERLNNLRTPTTGAMLGFALVMWVGMFAVAQVVPISQTYTFFGIFDLQMAFFPQYILMFMAGMLAYRSEWLSSLPGKTLRFWGLLSAGIALFLPVFMLGGGAADGHLDEYLTGLNLRCAVMTLWFGLASVAFSTTLTLWLRDRKNQNARLASFAGANNFAVYLVHPLVLVPITHGLRFMDLTPALKFGIASLLTVAACYLLATVLRKIPGVKAVL